MRILKNVTQDELKRYASQPTAKALHERMMKDSVYVPKGGVLLPWLSIAGNVMIKRMRKFRLRTRKPGQEKPNRRITA